MRAVVHDESLPFASCVVPHVVNLPAEGSVGVAGTSVLLQRTYAHRVGKMR